MLSLAFVVLAQADPQPPSAANMLVFVACFGVIFYFGIMRPQQMRQKQMQKLVSSLKTGDKVVTSGGIHGIVSNVKDGTTLTLKIADNVKIEVDKSAIAQVEGATATTTVLPPKAA